MTSHDPKLRFLSLFVPNLEEAARRYESVLGVAPCEGAGRAPREHPFAAAGPVVFELGDVSIALYQCDMRATHPGDVGIGLESSPSPGEMAQRAGAKGSGDGQVFFGPKPISDTDTRELAVFVLPDRHFFEVVGPQVSDDSKSGR